jgi:hypothetical protein
MTEDGKKLTKRLSRKLSSFVLNFSEKNDFTEEIHEKCFKFRSNCFKESFYYFHEHTLYFTDSQVIKKSFLNF